MRGGAPTLSGVLVVDKPLGPTSHDVVRRVRRRLEVKAGHTGTLDPLATGVLPVLVGKATRLARFYQGDDKVYLAEIRLGQTTETYDREGRVVREAPVPTLNGAEVQKVLDSFTGIQQQTPPMYSAVRIDGERLYKAARRGETRDRPSRRVTIHELEALERRNELWTVRVRCSSGVYVRSLAHDVGNAVGCGGHLYSLRRLRSGPFDLARAVGLEQTDREWKKALFSLEELLPELPRLDLPAAQAVRVRHGNPVRDDGHGEVVRLFDKGALIALARREKGWVAPMIVLADPPEGERSPQQKANRDHGP